MQPTNTDIHDYENIEKILKESERKLIEAQLIARMGDFTWDLRTNEVVWSEGIYRLLGYDPAEIVDYAKVNAEIHHPADVERVNKWLQECIDSGLKNLTPNEYRLFNKNKEIVWVQVKGRIVYQDNKAICIFGTVQDITERKEVEIALSRSEKLFRAITEQSGEGIILSDHQGKNVLVNEAFCQMTGYNKEELLQMNILNLLHLGNKSTAFPKIIHKQPHRREVELRRKDGTVLFVEVGGYPLKLDNQVFALGSICDISERKRIEKELQTAQIHYTNFINISSDIISYWKMPEGLRIDLPLEVQIDMFHEAVCIDCNKTFCKTIGIEDKEQVVGKKVSELFPRVSPPPPFLIEFFKNYQLNNLEIYAPPQGGLEFYGLSTWYGIIEDGYFTYLWRTTKDITERKQAEIRLQVKNQEYEALNEELQQTNEELRQTNEELQQTNEELQQTNEELSKAKIELEKSEHNLLTAQSISAIGSYETDLITGLWKGSLEFCRIFGFEYGKKYTFQEFQDIVHPDDIDQVMAYFSNCIARQTDFNYEYRAINRENKNIIFVKSNSKIYYDSQGTPLKIIGAKQDITEIKTIQLELEQHKHHLESLVRERTDELESSNEELAQLNEELYSANEQLFTQTQEMENTLKQLKNAQAQLLQSEKMASLGVLVAGIAHEINNPINFINSNIIGLKQNLPILEEVIQLYEQLSQENFEQISYQIKEKEDGIPISELMLMFGEALDHIAVGVERTTNIVKGLRTFTRADEERLSNYDVHENIENTLLILHNQYKHRIEIIREFGNIPPIQCYAGLINQVFMNLLANAIQAIQGEGTITIRTGISGGGSRESEAWSQGSVHTDTQHLSPDTSHLTPDTFILISVKDSGCGIPEENLTKIFDPFFTTKKVGEGTGLGLSIVYNNILKHNGKISVNSKIDQGTEFNVYLPRKQDPKSHA